MPHVAAAGFRCKPSGITLSAVPQRLLGPETEIPYVLQKAIETDNVFRNPSEGLEFRLRVCGNSVNCLVRPRSCVSSVHLVDTCGF